MVITEMLYLRVSDTKQYVYCPRIVFYQYVMPVEKTSTFKMDYGRMAEERIDRLELRRGFKRNFTSGSLQEDRG